MIPITFQEIWCYNDLMQWGMNPWEVSVIKRMDNAIRNLHRKDAPPIRDTPVDEDTEGLNKTELMKLAIRGACKLPRRVVKRNK